MPGPLEELTHDLWYWQRRHPEWHPGEFGAAVGSYAARVGEHLLLIDPLVDGETDPVVPALDRLRAGPVRIMISIPYHVRSAEMLWERYRAFDARILGHALAARRLRDTTGFVGLTGGEDIDGCARVHRIGRPPRAELPFEIPFHRAVVFGDAVVEWDGALHVWDDPLGSENRRRWWHERFLPTMRMLLDLDVERVLVTHGRPVLAGGREALRQAFDRGPWQLPGRVTAGP